jgi:hypothetical protein
VTNSFVVTVTEVNAAPAFAATPADASLAELTLLTVTNSATDGDQPANTLTYSLVSAPSGAAISAAGVITWTPTEAQGPSTNTLTSVVSDGTVSRTNSFTVTVTEVNVAPIAGNNSYTVSNATLTVSAPGVLGNDTDSDLPANTLTALVVSTTSNGTLNLNSNGSFTYTPNIGFSGVDTFTYRANDGLTSSAVATVTLTVVDQGFRITSVTANAGVATVTWLSQSGKSYRLLYKDDLNAANWSVVSNDVVATSVVTSKTNSVAGVAQRFYRVQLVTNTAPALGAPSNRTIAELTTLTVTNSATDANLPNELLTYALLNAPVGAVISPNTGVITWTPTEAQGPSTNLFTIKVTDNGGLSATNSFSVTVTEVNVAPAFAATPTNRTIAELTLLTVTNSATDGDLPANALTYSLVGAPSGATISAAGVITWTPTEAQGPSTNTITSVVSDGTVSRTNNFTVTVTEVNVAPVAVNDSYSVTNSTLTVAAPGVLANDTDADLPANTLRALLVGNPAHGSVTLSTNGGFTYTPSVGYSGSDAFTYRTTDGVSTSAVATVTLTVSNRLFVITSITASNGVARITWNSVAGQVYRVQYKDSLTAATWTDLLPDVLATNISTSTTNFVGNVPQRFYRVMLAPQQPTIISLKVTNALATITWTAVPTKVYRLQYKTNLTDVSWTEVATGVTATGITASTTNAVGGSPQRFYRVRLLP